MKRFFHNAAGSGTTDEDDELLLVEEDVGASSLVISMDGSRLKQKRKRRKYAEEKEGRASESEPEIDRQLDQSLETKSKQHNLTTANIKTIIHEVITNEHVVAMMKAAINDTEAPPPFELKMTRSKLKEVVERGVVIPDWNLSPIKKSNIVSKPPHFVDLPLADEDSSDEEYRPDEDEDDETNEDTLQESDLDSTASSPRGSRFRDESSSPWQLSRSLPCRLRAESVPMGPPPPPRAMPIHGLSDSPKAPPPRAVIDRRIVSDSTFLEKLNEVEAELSVCQSFQPLQDVDLMASRTRSKHSLTDVPLERLEAELRVLNPDFNETRSSLDPDPDQDPDQDPEEDRDWTDWLRGLMTSDVEEEADDDDDPEYNFLADRDEPDLEDYRDDRGVRITKKEVSELMEELFETLKDDLASQDVDEEEEETETTARSRLSETPVLIQTVAQPPIQALVQTSVQPPVMPLVQPPVLKTVRQQLEFLQKNMKQTMMKTKKRSEVEESENLFMREMERERLRQQVQQHVQLLTQVHLLCAPVSSLKDQAQTTRDFLMELDFLGQGAELMMSSDGRQRSSAFRVCNLQGALQLLEETRVQPVNYRPDPPRVDPRGNVKAFPLMPADLAWFFATRSLFLYPELLPCVSLDPALYCPRRKEVFTAAEDCLLVLGLRSFRGTSDPVKLVSDFVLRKTVPQVRRRILECCRPGNRDNVVKAYRLKSLLMPMPKACSPQMELCPPVERGQHCPLWLNRSIPVLHAALWRLNSDTPPPCTQAPPLVTKARTSHRSLLRSDWSRVFPPGSTYPPTLPKKQLEFRRIGFVLLNPPPDSRQITEQGEEDEFTLHLSETDTGSPSSNHDAEMEDKTGSDITSDEVVLAQNVCVAESGERVVWSRKADRKLLLAVQKGGANRKTFGVVSSQLPDKTLEQVEQRLRDLMTLFHSANHKEAFMQKAPD
ncbi:unnamed protein product [Knipowitschia caucasica]